MPVTLRDVARHAGVSVRTVSNVANDFPHVAPGTRARVQRSIDQLGYRINPAARGLRTGRTGVLGLMVPKLSQPYFAELADETVQAAADAGLALMVEQTEGRREAERSWLRPGGMARMWDGAIVSPLGITGSDLAERLGCPVVLLGEHAADLRAPWVGGDNVAAAVAAVEHLIALGHSEIAAIGAQRGAGGETGRERTKGFRLAMSDAGLPVGKGRVVEPVSFDAAGGAAAVRTLLASPRPPTALMCFNDELAYGALAALAQARVSVPDEVSVIGWDDLRGNEFTVPALTSVRVPKALVAREAVRLLLSLLGQPGGTEPAPVRIVIDHHITERASTGPAV